MQIGKLPPHRLRELVLGARGRQRPDVLLGPAIGEDAAVIDFGDEVMVISSDPITGAFQGAGRLAVHVAANDVAATGAEPVGVQPVLLWPPGPDAEMQLARTMQEIAQAAQALGMAVLGGHTEITSRVQDGLIIMTCVGRAPRHAYVPSGGGQSGDDLYLIGAAGLEGTSILAGEHGHLLSTLPPDILRRALALGESVSVVQAALAARDAGVRAMHDVTEGGVLGAVWEMAYAAGLGAEVERCAVPVRPETDAICRVLNLDPLRLLGSGALVVATPDGQRLKEALAPLGTPVTRIGRLGAPGEPVRLIEADGRVHMLADCPEDQLWEFLRSRNTKG